MDENVASALPSDRRADKGALGARIASAAILAPVAIGAVYLGSPWLPLLVAVAAGIMAWEWGRLCGALSPGRDLIRDPKGWLVVGISPLAVIGTVALAPWAGLLVGLAGLGLVLLLLRPSGAWVPGGLAWIMLPCIALVWLGDEPERGRQTTAWLLATVWAIDIMAYAAGKSFGGPKLAPWISPNKTWAGLIGGIAGAILIGFATARILDLPAALPLVVLSAGLAIFEQIGDMAESYAKRRFGVKNSSSLIPGHGGLLDRLDGMLMVVVVVAFLNLVSGGSVLTWR